MFSKIGLLSALAKFIRKSKIPDHFLSQGGFTHVERKWSGILDMENALNGKRRELFWVFLVLLVFYCGFTDLLLGGYCFSSIFFTSFWFIFLLFCWRTATKLGTSLMFKVDRMELNFSRFFSLLVSIR